VHSGKAPPRPPVHLPLAAPALVRTCATERRRSVGDGKAGRIRIVEPEWCGAGDVCGGGREGRSRVGRCGVGSERDREGVRAGCGVGCGVASRVIVSGASPSNGCDYGARCAPNVHVHLCLDCRPPGAAVQRPLPFIAGHRQVSRDYRGSADGACCARHRDRSVDGTVCASRRAGCQLVRDRARTNLHRCVPWQRCCG
jgi:hypothetical protein